MVAPRNMDLSYLPFALAVLAVCGVLLFARYRGRRAGMPLPPGPRGMPFVGNLLEMPSSFEWETYMRWSREYNSDIVYASVAGSSIVVLSSVQAATDLLEKRSTLYSDRPRFPMVNELMGWGFSFSFMKYGERWRKLRKLFHQHFNAEGVANYYPLQHEAAQELLRRLLHEPDHFLDHFRHMAGGTIISAVYGIEARPVNDPYVQLSEDALKSLLYASIPGRFLVDLIPVLMHVPEWLPGTGFKRLAREWSQLKDELVERPFAETQKQMHAAATSYSAGTDTLVAFLGSFVRAMRDNPEVQRKAQAEVEAVLGIGTLPDFDAFGDAENKLPFVSAVIREVLRWRPPLPFPPHFVETEDEYRGYRIPAGSIVLANIWAMMHDETAYPNPESTYRARAGTSRSASVGASVWGKHLAMASIWMAVVSILAAFDIRHRAVGDGEASTASADRVEGEGNLRKEYISGLVMQPLPFKHLISIITPVLIMYVLLLIFILLSYRLQVYLQHIHHFLIPYT
ncbi:Cytochrome P450 [Mycena chlorophos]|uniref:Cytochrome P450 n=1 Tax=Mycena chlorophos TaxID=658473 RepID=A0A8H6TL57_MYCCL|nr:Cytochrome P450 [Mycena chlorophos]